MKTTYVNVRVPQALKEKLEIERKRVSKIAGFEVTMSVFIRMVLTEKIEGK